jgi:hypothetical protein
MIERKLICLQSSSNYILERCIVRSSLHLLSDACLGRCDCFWLLIGSVHAHIRSQTSTTCIHGSTQRLALLGCLIWMILIPTLIDLLTSEVVLPICSIVHYSLSYLIYLLHSQNTQAQTGRTHVNVGSVRPHRRAVLSLIFMAQPTMAASRHGISRLL